MLQPMIFVSQIQSELHIFAVIHKVKSYSDLIVQFNL